MSGIFDSKKTTESHQTTETGPYKPAVKTIDQIIGQIGGLAAQPIGPSAGQAAAIGALKAQAEAGNPFTGQIRDVATKQFGATSSSPMARDAYGTLQAQLTPFANGSKASADDPTLQAAIKAAADEVQNRISSQYAGAGRDFSGASSKAIATGVTNAVLPAQLSYIADQQGKQIDAAKTLYGAGQSTAQNVQNLDANALEQNSKGIDTAKSYLEAQGWGPTQIANLEQQLKSLPAEDVGRVLQLILPVAQLGGTSVGDGKSVQTSSPSPFSQLGTLLKGASMVGSFFDEGADTVPGTSANGGWETTTKPAAKKWFGFV